MLRRAPRAFELGLQSLGSIEDELLRTSCTGLCVATEAEVTLRWRHQAVRQRLLLHRVICFHLCQRRSNHFLKAKPLHSLLNTSLDTSASNGRTQTCRIPTRCSVGHSTESRKAEKQSDQLQSPTRPTQPVLSSGC